MTLHNEVPPKPKLIPVEVPWKVALATPFLKFTVREFEPAQVDFVARFKSTNNGEEFEQIVTVTFTGMMSFRGGSAQNDGDVPIDETSYDWSEVRLRPHSVETLNKWVKQFNQEWQMSKICPDPGMYEVHNSDWSSLLQSGETIFTHFLIIGEEKYVEILSRTWHWTAKDL